MWLRKLKQVLCINLEGWDGEADKILIKFLVTIPDESVLASMNIDRKSVV